VTPTPNLLLRWPPERAPALRLVTLGAVLLLAAVLVVPVASVADPTVGTPGSRAATLDASSPLAAGLAGASLPLVAAATGPAPTGSNPDAILASVELGNDSLVPSLGVPAPGSSPEGVAFDPVQQLVFVVDGGLNFVSVYDANLTHLVATIPVGDSPAGIAYAPNSGEMVVADYGSNAVSIINDTNLQVVATDSVGDASGYFASGPTGVAYDPIRHSVLVTSRGHYEFPCCVTNLTEVDTASTSNSVVGTVTVGGSPVDVQFSADSGLLYVEDEFTDLLTVVNASSLAVLSNNSLGIEPVTGVVDDPDGLVLVAGYNATSALVVDAFKGNPPLLQYETSQTLGFAFVGSLAYDAVTSEVIAAVGRTLDTIAPLTGTVTSTGVSGICFEGVAVASSIGRVYATDACAQRTVALSDVTLAGVADLDSGGHPTAVFDDPATGQVWVNDLDGQSAQALDGATFASAVWAASGTSPVEIAADPTNDSAIVLSQGSLSDGSLAGNTSYELVPNGSTSGSFVPIASASDGLTFPLAMGVDASRDQLAISEITPNGLNNELQLAVYALTNGTLLATVNLSALGSDLNFLLAEPAAVLPVPNSNVLAVTDPLQSTVIGVDLANDTVAWRTTLIAPAVTLAYDPVDASVLAATNDSPSVTAIDPVTGGTNATILLEENASGITYDPLNERVYVAENDHTSPVGGQVESFAAANLGSEELVAGFNANLGGIAYLHLRGVVGVIGDSTGLLYLLGQHLNGASLQAASATVIIGHADAFTAAASDGYAPYNLTFTGLPTGCTTANLSVLTCTPTAAGHYTVTVAIRDMTGTTLTANVAIVVQPPPISTGITLASGATASGTTQAATLGVNVTLTASVTSEGVAELGAATVLNWTIAPIANGTLNGSHGQSVTVSFFDPGSITVILTAYYEGTTNTSNVTFDVGEGTHSTTPPASSESPLLLVVAIVVVVVVVMAAAVGYAMIRRRSAPAPAEAPATEPASEEPPEQPPQP
jgi:YVTN family beta-propeller protein